MEHWYTLFTKPRREYQVSDALHEKGIETFVPTIYVRRRGRTVERPFFPRYMFARVDFDKVGVSQVQWTPGLTYIVGFGGGPTPVPEPIIMHLRKRLEEINSAGTFSILKRGDRVRITSGPLRDLEAVFEEHLSSKERVRILLDILGRVTRVEIDADAIERIG